MEVSSLGKEYAVLKSCGLAFCKEQISPQRYSGTKSKDTTLSPHKAGEEKHHVEALRLALKSSSSTLA